ncbi:hypothetical protein G8A07_00070 [Roseateles sp. DAIF2]|uniref:hypothetical protein n=1 Tax=Roseateles sp. DAIF2 TaxID=2714952 RepID=UPI0018A24DFD|nr:hypothetical protein [Roseateles sp. DAIF2]QPF71472.1 hypothetical protein G8A07_00070 [Roseateles sp. DAIF2]
MQVALATLALALAPAFAQAEAPPSPSDQSATATNATELSELLRRELKTSQYTPVRLVAITLESGCGPKGCSVDAERLSVQTEPQGQLLNNSKGKERRVLQLVEHRPAAGQPLPELDWRPSDAWRVFVGQRRWGSCLEFSHSGLGKSGRLQRWSTVVLVPFHRNQQPGPTAHRFSGYWSGCDMLMADIKSGILVLPILEPVAAAQESDVALQLVHYRCGLASGCAGRPSPLRVTSNPDTGALNFQQPVP